MKLRLPYLKLRSNKKPQYSRSIVAVRLIVKAAGGNWLGFSERLNEEMLALFNDGAGGDLLSLPMSEVSMVAVKDKLEKARTAENRLRQSNRKYYAGVLGDPDFLWEHPEVQII